MNANEIRARIPHAGDMCLIEHVSQWDQESISCVSTTHTRKNNPLRYKDKLPVSALIEYGAQAMAIHGSLANEQTDESQGGYLASLKNVNFYVGDLEDVKNELTIQASKVYSDGKNMIYNFSVSDCCKKLISGRATVFGRNIKEG